MRECRELGKKKRMEWAAEKYFWPVHNYFLQLLFGCFGKWNLDLDLDFHQLNWMFRFNWSVQLILFIP